jgi:hypothetical protein
MPNWTRSHTGVTKKLAVKRQPVSNELLAGCDATVVAKAF